MACDDVFTVLQASAREGSLLSSCEPEVKELMHQLDILISAKCGKLEEEVEFLKNALMKKETKVKELKSAAAIQEQKHRAHSADCEAQLVRLRSEVTRISQSYEQLKEKRYHHHHHRGGSSELLQELERVKLRLHLSNNELRMAFKQIAHLEENQRESLEADSIGAQEKTLVTENHHQTLETLEMMFDKHCQQLNQDILKIFAN